MTAPGPRPFTLRPLRVEAMRWLPDDPRAVGAMVAWLVAADADFSHPSGSGLTTTLRLSLSKQLAEPGDWVIRRADGWVFTLGPDQFSATYETGAAVNAKAGAR